MRRFRTARTAAALILLLAACQASPTGPAPERVETARTIQVAGDVQLVPVRSGRIVRSKDSSLVRLVSALLGGTLQTSRGRLTVPPLALLTSTTISMTDVRNGTVTIRFGPSGLRFLRPATLAISTAEANLDGIDPSRLRIAGASDAGDDWRVIGGVYDPRTRTVVVPLEHFSQYALCVE